jgi:nicotinamide-nucleotide amidase
VTYSNRSKVQLLGVRQETLDKYGAVSEQTAHEMAEGVRKNSGTDLGLSITGIAGPDGGTAEKPVGLVYAALSCKDGVTCKELRLWGSRNRIRNVTTLHVFDMVRRYFMNKTNE